EMDWGNSDFPVWIEAGEKDGVFPPDRVDYFKEALTEKGYPVESNVIPGGDHNAPVEQINWKEVVDYLENKYIHVFYEGEDYSIVFIRNRGLAYIDPQGEIIVYGYMFDNGPDYFKEG